MKIKTSELTDAALDWAVEKAIDSQNKPLDWAPSPYSTDWSQGGPIIERENISLVKVDQGEPVWSAYPHLRELEEVYRVRKSGSTPLIAAMRCYVASVLGDEINVPEELCNLN